MKIPNGGYDVCRVPVSLARIVSEDSQLRIRSKYAGVKSSKDS